MSLSTAIASAVAYTVCQDLAAEPCLGAPYNDVARFLDEQIARMPQPQGWGVRVLALAFDLAALPSQGARFHRLRHEARRRHLAAWRQSPLFFCRQFVRLHESLAAYRLYARLEEGPVGGGS